jgi:hypothetical protein
MHGADSTRQVVEQGCQRLSAEGELTHSARGWGMT